MSWKELEEAATVHGGTSEGYHTEGWRVSRPVINESKCTNCLLCWIYCPEPAIVRHEGSKVTIDYEHCKGCGICESECPVRAITMVREP
ncbi:MAG TPA: 4Fe-4S binding protein [Conexivisphaerales archaeon]|nr:4Fe-4S binding protein [Conexivisphaerales archaeon]